MSTTRDRLARAGLFAKKQLGQHFLLDPAVTRKVAAVAAPLEGRVILEIGPGPGGLTEALLDAGAAQVIAIERDPRFQPLLQELASAYPGRLEIVEADAMRVNEAALLAERGVAEAGIAANLPYNIGTALLIKWLKAPSPWRGPMSLMFQKEVAQRIAAQPGEAAYGRLAVLAQSVTRPRLCLTLPAGAFTPPPKVASAVVRLDPSPDPFPDLAALEAVTAAAFGQRRKMLRSALKPLGCAEALIAAASLEGSARAEELSVADFQRLALAWRRSAQRQSEPRAKDEHADQPQQEHP